MTDNSKQFEPLDSEKMRQHLITVFKNIEKTRMDGVPILNNELDVAAFGFEAFGKYHLGVMLTPWFMNLMIVPPHEEDVFPGIDKVGESHLQTLPGGRFSFITGHEDSLGYYLSCSLFSPVFEFEDQAAAAQTAQAVLEQVLTPVEGEDDESDEDAEMRAIWAGKLPEEEEEQSPEEVGNTGETDNIGNSRNVQKKRPRKSKISRRELLTGTRTEDDIKKEE